MQYSCRDPVTAGNFRVYKLRVSPLRGCACTQQKLFNGANLHATSISSQQLEREVAGAPFDLTRLGTPADFLLISPALEGAPLLPHIVMCLAQPLHR